MARPGTPPSKVKAYLDTVNGSLGNKHAHYRALRVFFRWLYSPKSGMRLNPLDNPMLYVDAPKLQKLILPSLTREQVNTLVDRALNQRDRAKCSVKLGFHLRGMIHSISRINGHPYNYVCLSED